MLLQRSFFCFTLILAWCAAQECSAQSAPPGNAAVDPALADAVQQLQEQVKELRSVIADLRSESERYRAETRELRDELHAAEAQMPAVNQAARVQAAQATSSGASQDTQYTTQSDDQDAAWRWNAFSPTRPGPTIIG